MVEITLCFAMKIIKCKAVPVVVHWTGMSIIIIIITYPMYALYMYMYIIIS